MIANCCNIVAVSANICPFKDTNINTIKRYKIGVRSVKNEYKNNGIM